MANNTRSVFLSRKMYFCAAHRLNSKRLTEAENRELYGICNRPSGHGHTYTVEITIYGKVNEKTGILLNTLTLKHYMEKAVIDNLDHRNLDKDVDFFKHNPSTAENICYYIWREMKKVMDKPDLLHEVKLSEYENDIVTYKG